MRSLGLLVLGVCGFLTTVWLLIRFANHELMLVALCFSICLPIIYLLLERGRQKHQLLTMKEEALRAELSLLKNQINPHFFFNTLNNLYGLALEKSDLTPELILRLSDLMRFTIYEGRKDHVFLRDEVTYLENYLEIQRIRIRQKSLDLRFTWEIDDALQQVPPLMLILLVENAFKHGVATVTKDAFVHLELRANTTELQFNLENNFGPAKAKKPGIGLVNLERRLELLFPKRHQFKWESEEGIYRVWLTLTF